LVIAVFLGALAAAYVAAGSARIGYAGFQMAFAFFLCVIQGSGPSFDLVVARDRVIGILLGNIVVYLLFTHLWPVSISRRIDPAVASVLRRLSAMMRAATVRERRALASEVQTTLTSLETDIDLARYEPPAIRPNLRWLDTRRDAAREMSSLDGLLLLTGAGGGGGADAGAEAEFRGSVAHRLDGLAGHVEASSEAPAPLLKSTAQSARDGQPHAVVEGHVRRLEEALGGSSAIREETAGYAT
jgi:multidrug resistance protein MdtO